MHTAVQRHAPILEAIDHVEFPQRAGPIEPDFMQRAHLVEQRLHPGATLQRDAMYMRGGIDVGHRNNRRTPVERKFQLAVEWWIHRPCKHFLHELVGEIAAKSRRRPQYDQRTDMKRPRLGFEQKHREVDGRQ